MHYKYNAVVNRIVDGDTFGADVDLGFYTHLHIRSFRIARINTAELNSTILEERQAAQAAKDWLSTMLLDKDVIIESKSRDKYGRWLAEVTVNGLNISDEMLKLGLAKPY